MARLLIVALIAITVSVPAYADRGGRGSWIGPALIGGIIGYSLARPYYPYYSYYPYPVYQQPYPIYVQPAPSYAPDIVAPSVQYWYFCPEANAYYPYVAFCPHGWQAVPAIPPR